METMGNLEGTRRCWRLINGVLIEKTKDELLPELKTHISNVSPSLNNTQTLYIRIQIEKVLL